MSKSWPIVGYFAEIPGPRVWRDGGNKGVWHRMKLGRMWGAKGQNCSGWGPSLSKERTSHWEIRNRRAVGLVLNYSEGQPRRHQGGRLTPIPHLDQMPQFCKHPGVAPLYLSARCLFCRKSLSTRPPSLPGNPCPRPSRWSPKPPSAAVLPSRKGPPPMRRNVRSTHRWRPYCAPGTMRSAPPVSNIHAVQGFLWTLSRPASPEHHARLAFSKYFLTNECMS